MAGEVMGPAGEATATILLNGKDIPIKVLSQ